MDLRSPAAFKQAKRSLTFALSNPTQVLLFGILTPRVAPFLQFEATPSTQAHVTSKIAEPSNKPALSTVTYR